MGKNKTDYDLPTMWGEMTDEEKHTWYVRERVFRQACRQDTAFGREHDRAQRDGPRDIGRTFTEAWGRTRR